MQPINFKLSDPNNALKEVLGHASVVFSSIFRRDVAFETLFPDGRGEDDYPRVTVANLRAAARRLAEIADLFDKREAS
jgi:hypothetical protein